MKRRIIGIVAAIALASVGTFALVSYVQSAKDEALADEALVEVYVLSQGRARRHPRRRDRARPSRSRGAQGRARRGRGARPRRPRRGARRRRRPPRRRAAAHQPARRPSEAASDGRARRPPGGDRCARSRSGPSAASSKVGDTVGVVLSFDPFETDVVRSIRPTRSPCLSRTRQPSSDGDSGDRDDEDDGDDHPKTPNMTHLTFHKVLVTGVQFDETTPRPPARRAIRAGEDER